MFPPSFEPDTRRTVTTDRGAVAHVAHVAHGEVLRRQFIEVRDGVWTFVGNGLSNQSFLAGPEGIVAIDTGESIEEMAAALRELRRVTDAPIAAVLYTHFHYVEGTEAIFTEANHLDPLPIYGHPRLKENRRRIAGEIAPAYARGVVEQFGLFMPSEGEDALVNDGLGLYFSNPAHAPFTPGHRPVTVELRDRQHLTLAGLEAEIDFAPSDADDSITVWFPELGVAVHNLIWPTLFNIYAIRGEEYRDPRVLIAGIDRLRAHRATFLLGTHGPPLVGADENAERCERSRDALQFLWDQTVRGINAGSTADELAAEVRLPELYQVDYLTSERYGIVEHHVRQIHNGLRGFFDGEESHLLPLPPLERHDRLIEGFGGKDAVRAAARAALEGDDLRWGTELATWLVRSSDAELEDRLLLSSCLRTIAQRTASANLRNWCIARARHLDGTTPLDRLYRHRFTARSLEGRSATEVLSTLRVLVDPDAAADRSIHLVFVVDGERVGLHLRRGIAAVTDGHAADVEVTMPREVLEALLCGTTTASQLPGTAEVGIAGDPHLLAEAMACFDLEAWKR